MNGRDGWLTNELREYTARFVSEGSIISEQTYRRGEEVEQPEAPSHEIDGENNYLFIGWDTNGDNLIDFVPPRIYYSFTANAVYMNTGKFDLSFLDLTNMDLETLLQLMETLNIDWEQFMDMFNIDPETLMDWLSKNAVLTFEADSSNMISYFRSTSYGDYNYSKKKFDAPSYYDSSRISEGSVNPLSFTADKLQNAYSLGGVLPETFSFISYDITFKAKQDYYPVPDCEYIATEDNFVDSDAHYLLKPKDSHYTTYAAYAPAFTQTVEMLRLLPFSNFAITQDEINYYRYALANYINVPKEYQNLIDGIIAENDWYEEDYTQIDNIGAYVEHLGYCSMFKDGEVNLSYKKNKDPVKGLIENGYGTDLDFNVTAMMIFRRLNIPARIVKGYVVPGINEGYNEITLLQQHYWCEIYVKNVGWMICDCMNAEEFLGTNPYGELDKKNNPLTNEKVLERIVVTPPDKTEYEQYESFDMTGMSVKAYYSDGSTKDIPLYECEVSGFNPFKLGEQVVTISYTELDVTKSDTFKVTIKEPPADLEWVEWNFDNVKTKFYQTDKFTSEGIVATGHYSDGKTKDLSKLVKVPEKPDMSISGIQLIHVTLQSDGRTFDNWYQIQVYDDEPVSFEITTLPTKLEYYTGDSFDYTGMVLTATFVSGNEAEIQIKNNSSVAFMYADDYDFYYADEHHTIEVQYRKQDDTIISQSFEVKIVEDTPVSMTINGYKDTYTVGDKFSNEIFTNNNNAVINLKSGRKIENIPANDLDIPTPDLGTPGDQTVNVGYNCYLTYGYVYYEQEFNITVNPVDEKTFAMQSFVPHAGPGTEMAEVPLFTYETDYRGIMYFRSGFYGDFDGNDTWSNSDTSSSYKNYAYLKAKTVYAGNDVTVHYEENMSHGVVPMYCGEDSLTSHNAVTAGTDVEFTKVTSFVLNDENYNRFKNYVGWSNSDNANQITYKNYVNTKYKAIDNKASYYSTIQNVLSMYGYGYLVNYDNLAKANGVKTLLSTYYSNIGATYIHDPTQDSITSFLNSHSGTPAQSASAAVMICRYLGVPARYCTGFGSNCVGPLMTVTTNNTHAWAEVWIDGIGWVILDPTGFDEGRQINGNYYYADGFGGTGFTNVLYPYGKTIDITYDYTGLTYKNGYYYFIYNGDSYYSLGTDGNKFTPYNSADDDYMPGHLYYTIELENQYNSDIGEYQMVPVLHVYDRVTGLADGDYNFQLGTGKDGFELDIVPAMIFVQVTPKKDSYSLSSYGDTVSLGINDFTLQVMTDLSDTLNYSYTISIVGSSVSFNEVGSYSDYDNKLILAINGQITDNVIIIAFVDEVVITP